MKGNKKGYEAVIAILIFLFLAITFLSPILTDIRKEGNSDWPQTQFYQEAPRKTIAEYNQLPLWNAWQCGGNVLWANPLNTASSPFFIFIMIFGPVIGIKLWIVALMFVGLIGMYLLSKQYGLKDWYAYIPAVIYLFSAPFAAYTASGQTHLLSMTLIPWVFYFYKRSLNNKKWLFMTAFSIAMLWFNPSLYLFIFTLMMLGLQVILDLIETNNHKILKIAVLTFLLGFLIVSIKFIPSMDVYLDNPRSINETDGLVLGDFIQTLTLVNNEQRPVHENATYVGVIISIILLISLVINWKKHWKLSFLAVFFLILTLGDKSPINLLGLLHNLPVFKSMHISMRFRIPFLFFASILAGITIQRLTSLNWKKLGIRQKTVEMGLLILMIYLTIHLLLINGQLMKNTFVMEPIVKSEGVFQQTIDYNIENERDKEWVAINQNKGAVSCYETTVIKTAQQMGGIWYYHIGAALPVDFLYYQGEVFWKENTDEVKIIYWSPNKVVVETNKVESNTIILNQNYHKGWHAYSKRENLVVSNESGLVATTIEGNVEGNFVVTFYYLPKIFLISSFISIITIAWIIFYLRREWK